MFKPTDEQWYAMCDARMSSAVALRDADLTKPFVYDRRFGLFYVPMGYHQQAMALLYAFHHGETRSWECAKTLGITYDGTSKLADRWLSEKPGTCYRSSMNKAIRCWKPGHLSAAELRYFDADTITYIAPPAADDAVFPILR